MSKTDKKFLTGTAMPAFGIRKLGIDYSPSTAKHPDIWVETGGPFPVITVTREWARQDMHERRKRLTHELLHCKGVNHGRKGRFTYSTYPGKDTYSRHIYEKITGGA